MRRFNSENGVFIFSDAATKTRSLSIATGYISKSQNATATVDQQFFCTDATVTFAPRSSAANYRGSIAFGPDRAEDGQFLVAATLLAVVIIVLLAMWSGGSLLWAFAALVITSCKKMALTPACAWGHSSSSLAIRPTHCIFDKDRKSFSLLASLMLVLIPFLPPCAAIGASAITETGVPATCRMGQKFTVTLTFASASGMR